MRFMLLRKQFCVSTDVYCVWTESKSFKFLIHTTAYQLRNAC